MKKTEYQKLRSLEAKLDNWLKEQANKKKSNKQYTEKKREQLNNEDDF